MTIKVVITHDTPGYDKDIEVDELDVDTEIGFRTVNIHTVSPGETKTFYIYGNRYLEIWEIPRIQKDV